MRCWRAGQRGDDIGQGAGAVVAYEEFMANGDQDSLDRIADYNADDVRATRALRDCWWSSEMTLTTGETPS
ncbi:MAG: ribonuclease H-like domain-containing protein [Candidatus Microthrix sp.]|nr:ribonuclease H-like domain-containing protein [Candidatus Microthrix sp.]MBK7019718.1 ribonuclease H-like domain-containing protein [Candidatus Microthrix sp.]